MDPSLRPAVLVDLEPLATQLRRIADALERRVRPLEVTPVASPAPAAQGSLALEVAATQELPLDRFAQRLFEDLREWRRDRARMEGVPPYFVASDRSLKDVARVRPTTLDSLRDLRGFGPVKTSKFGREILEVIAMAR